MNPIAATHTPLTSMKYVDHYRDIEPIRVFAPELVTSCSVHKLTWKTEPAFLQGVPNNLSHTQVQQTYQLTGYDVLVGRHKLAFHHKGNRRFRVIISMFLPRYFKYPSRKDRSLLIAEIVETIQQAGGHFLKQTRTNQLVEISEKEKRNKVGHALRDAAAAEHAAQAPKAKTKKFMKQESVPVALEKYISVSDDDEEEIDFDNLFE